MTLPDSPLLGWGTPDDDERLLPLNKSSIALSSSIVVKTGPGILYGFTVFNTNASNQYIHVFDAAQLPSDGSVPACVFIATGTQQLPVNWIPGRTFTTGIILCNSTTAATKTLGASDCFFDCQFV